MSKRKAFNFYFSYYDSAKLLSDLERLKFYDAMMEKQFYGIDPQGLKGNLLLTWTGQKHSVETQVKGWEDKMGESLQITENHTTIPPSVGGYIPPSVQEKEKEKEEEKEEEKYTIFLFDLNKALNKNFKGDKKSKGQFNQRIKDGFTIENFNTAIKNAVADQYHKETNYKYITPEFLTRADKLDKFGQITIKQQPLKSSFI